MMARPNSELKSIIVYLFKTQKKSTSKSSTSKKNFYASSATWLCRFNMQLKEKHKLGFILKFLEAMMELDFKCSDVGVWKEALSSYESRIESLNKPDLISLDQFYRIKLPSLLHDRDPNPYLTTSELSQLMKWKLSRGKWRPRLLDFVSSLDDSVVKSASEKAFKSLPDISKAVKELTVLKGVGPATASAVLAAYAPDIAPFMSDEAMEVALGSSKDYSLKQYLLFVTKLQDKAKELKMKGDWDGLSDIERALWSCTVRAKSQPEKSSSGKKRKR